MLTGPLLHRRPLVIGAGARLRQRAADGRSPSVSGAFPCPAVVHPGTYLEVVEALQLPIAVCVANPAGVAAAALLMGRRERWHLGPLVVGVSVYGDEPVPCSALFAAGCWVLILDGLGISSAG